MRAIENLHQTKALKFRFYFNKLCHSAANNRNPFGQTPAEERVIHKKIFEKDECLNCEKVAE